MSNPSFVPATSPISMIEILQPFSFEVFLPTEVSTVNYRTSASGTMPLSRRLEDSACKEVP
jgi:hypothetical protein